MKTQAKQRCDAFVIVDPLSERNLNRPPDSQVSSLDSAGRRFAGVSRGSRHRRTSEATPTEAYRLKNRPSLFLGLSLAHPEVFSLRGSLHSQTGRTGCESEACPSRYSSPLIHFRLFGHGPAQQVRGRRASARSSLLRAGSLGPGSGKTCFGGFRIRPAVRRSKTARRGRHPGRGRQVLGLRVAGPMW